MAIAKCRNIISINEFTRFANMLNDNSFNGFEFSEISALFSPLKLPPLFWPIKLGDN